MQFDDLRSDMDSLLATKGGVAGAAAALRSQPVVNRQVHVMQTAMT